MKRQHKPINRDNYEIWFIDYMDGQLTEAGNELLQEFLLENPELSIELSNLAGIALTTPESITFPDKALLKKAPEPFSELREYDFQMVKAVEEGQSAPENLNILSPLAQKDWELYQKTRLQAGSLVYPHKSKLKHRQMAFIPAALRAVAAAILLLILFNVSQDMPTRNHDQMVTVTEKASPTEQTPQITQTEPNTPRADERIKVPDRLAAVSETPAKAAVVELTSQVIKETPSPLPGPKTPTLPTPRLPDSYEIGLQLMLPKYVENHRLMVSQSSLSIPRAAETNTKTVLNRTTELIKQVSPLNLTYTKVYNDEGDLVALNLSGDNFEIAQRVPRWLNVK